MVSAVLLCHSVRPGRVEITSTETTCNSIIIHWISPNDENGIPYELRVRYSYKEPHQTRTSDIVIASSEERNLTVRDIPRNVPVKFSLAAINKKSKAGPTVQTTITIDKPC